MKVLILTSNYPRWRNDSTTPFVHNFAHELVKQGHTVKVVAPHFKGAKKKEEVDGVMIRRFTYFLPERAQTVCYQGGALGNLDKNPFEKFKLPALVFFEFICALKEVLFWKPDVVNSHWLLPQGFVGTLVCKLTRTKHVATIHGGDVFSLNSSIFRKLKAFSINNSDLITVNSSATEKVTKELAPKTKTPYLRLPTGILPLPNLVQKDIEQLRSYLKKSDNEKLVLFVGRLSEEKGIREAIQAVHKLLLDKMALRLIIVGDGHERMQFQQLAIDLKISEYVEFIGWVDSSKIYNYFSACDVFVGPSKESKDGGVEAQGLTFIEAMLAGCPVIGSNSGGIPDAVIHGKTGRLCEPNNDESLKASLEAVFNDMEKTELMKDYATVFAKNNYLVSNTVKRFIQEIER